MEEEYLQTYRKATLRVASAILTGIASALLLEIPLAGNSWFILTGNVFFVYIKPNCRYSSRAVFAGRMITIHDIITSTQFGAIIALVATAIIVVALRPRSDKHKQKPSHHSQQ